MDKFTYKKIEEIEFGILSPKMIKKMSAVKVVTPELYDKEGYPVDGGLMDIRLGVIDPGLKCKTCGSKLKECIGHFGHITLARPVIFVNFVPLILTLLKCTCQECGRVLIPQKKIDDISEELDSIEEEQGLEKRRKRIKELIVQFRTLNKCPHCKARQKKVSLEKPTTFLENEKKVSPIEIRSKLEKIKDDDLFLFGVDPEHFRPEWAVLTIFAIPPVTMRPSITLESGERSEDDLTHKLGDIVRINQRLFENINAGAPEIIIEDLWDLLQYHITTFFNNGIDQVPPARHRNGQPLKTIAERIKSKEGRIRHNLAGKRTNFSARTVISPDPMIRLNEVGIPIEVARKLTIPERVTPWNMEYMKKFIENGADKYVGSNYVVRPDGRRKRITDETKEQLLEEIQPGYVVERHLMNGDIAIFNRQPSLHKMSMMCHRIVVLPGKTFRINPSVCAPYNADFDGDEMNLHIPQTEEARAEAEVLMEVQTQLISPRYGLSIIGSIQDSLSGLYSLTKDGFEFPREDAVELLVEVGLTDFSRMPNKKMISGKEMFSMVIPEDFSFYGNSKNGDEVVIENGNLSKGVMDSANLGSESGLLLRNIHKFYGPDYLVDFLANVSKLGILTLKKIGFSTSISDIDLPEDIEKEIKDILDGANEKVDELIGKYRDKSLETFPGKSILETLEIRILETLNKARNEVGTIVSKNLNEKAGAVIMARSGARGKPLNLAQMAACVGQQSLEGGRINKGFRGRTLSCFNKDDLHPPARGFIRDGFRSGLKPHEFFFMAMTGRDALMDTALRTPKSGYLYRRLTNAMQDLKAEKDRSVRDASGRIIQFKYGEDGVDVSKSAGGIIDVRKIIKDSIKSE